MPAALKNPVLDRAPREPDFAPDNSAPTAPPTRDSSPAAPRASSARAGVSVSGASARVASPARITAREASPERDPLRDSLRERDISVSARPRPEARPAGRLVEEAALAPRKPLRIQRHRDFRPGVTAVLCGCTLMGQLVLLIWLHGKTLTSAREVERMDAQIAEVSNQIERTQGRIADYDSWPQIKHLATQKGWKPASHPDMDEVTKPQVARAQAEATAQAAPAKGQARDGEAATQ